MKKLLIHVSFNTMRPEGEHTMLQVAVGALAGSASAVPLGAVFS